LYRAITSLNVELNDDIRAVMDRMLASEEEIEAAQVRQGFEPMQLPEGEAGQIGLTEKQLADYAAMVEAATEEARADVTAKLLDAHRRAQEKQYKEDRARVKAEVVAEVEATPIVRAFRILSGRKEAAGQPVPEAMRGLKLDKAALVEVYGDGMLTKLGRVYALEGGVDQDTAAMVLGFTSGDALVQGLWTVQETLARVDAEVDARMR